MESIIKEFYLCEVLLRSSISFCIPDFFYLCRNIRDRTLTASYIGIALLLLSKIRKCQIYSYIHPYLYKIF